MKFPVFDLHCDTALALIDHGETKNRVLRINDCHIDLERAGKLPGYCQCFACFTTPFMQEWMKVSPEIVFQKEIEVLKNELANNSDVISQAFTAGDVENNLAKGMMSAILTIEGPAGFGFDPARLEELYAMGFRITSLGWNEQNVLAGSNVTGGGLTDLGREFVKEAQRLGMIVDVSHISDEAFWDMMKITAGPIVATHSNSRSIWNNSRNLTDDMFRAICETGGVAGYNACDEFTGENPTVDTICDHIFHFLELDPTGKHVALGGDLDGVSKMPEGFEGVQSWPVLADCLLARGLEEQTVMDIFWNNGLGVMELAVRNHP